MLQVCAIAKMPEIHDNMGSPNHKSRKSSTTKDLEHIHKKYEGKHNKSEEHLHHVDSKEKKPGTFEAVLAKCTLNLSKHGNFLISPSNSLKMHSICFDVDRTLNIDRIMLPTREGDTESGSERYYEDVTIGIGEYGKRWKTETKNKHKVDCGYAMALDFFPPFKVSKNKIYQMDIWFKVIGNYKMIDLRGVTINCKDVNFYFHKNGDTSTTPLLAINFEKNEHHRKSHSEHHISLFSFST